MKYPRQISFTVITLSILFVASCTYYTNPPPPGPPTPEETVDLEASFVTTAPSTINDPYWNFADYIIGYPVEISKELVDERDAFLNRNGMYEGISKFNKGDSAAVIIKAAYDDNNIYILAEWTDQRYNTGSSNWRYNGPVDPHKPEEDTIGWTGQFNDDKLIFQFNSGNLTDIWKWSLAMSEPLGYAIDMYDRGDGEETDPGDILLVRNTMGDDRSGPAWEFDGEQQEVTRPLAEITFLDAAYYLLNVTEFEGDIVEGEILYQVECAECHGVNGDGNGFEWQTFVPMEDPTLNRLNRSQLDQVIASNQHSGSRHWTKLDDQQKEDLSARIRGFSGLPGYFIEPGNTSYPDVLAVSNVNLSRININDREKPNYKVLLVRPLTTGNDTDIQFVISEGAEYTFDVLMTDNDDENRVGIRDLKLIFK